jgi:hypothetical protein
LETCAQRCFLFSYYEYCNRETPPEVAIQDSHIRKTERLALEQQANARGPTPTPIPGLWKHGLKCGPGTASPTLYQWEDVDLLDSCFLQILGFAFNKYTFSWGQEKQTHLNEHLFYEKDNHVVRNGTKTFTFHLYYGKCKC